MLKVDLVKAQPGMTLALPVTHPRQPGHILLRIGCALDHALIHRMTDLGVAHIWVKYPGLEFLNRYISPDAQASQARLLGQIASGFAAMQRQSNARLPYERYCRGVGELVHDLVCDPQAAFFLDDLANPETEDFDLLRHASTVTYLSVLMGLKLEGYLVRQRRRIDPVRAKKVTNLGLGAMLHDVGVMRLPAEVRERYLKTGDESDMEWREHPTLGFQLVREHVEPSAATVVLNHHQRYDGTGYGGSAVPVLDGERIHVFARVVALADGFDRLRRPLGRPARPTVAVLNILHRPASMAQFDPQAILSLFAVVPPYPPGSRLVLSDGRPAVCVEPHTGNPCRPTVAIQDGLPEESPAPAPGGLPALGEMLDLREAEESLHIAQCDDQPVAAFNFPAPAFLQNPRLTLACL